MRHFLTGMVMVSVLGLVGCQNSKPSSIETPLIETESKEELAAKERVFQYESLFLAVF